ncbi:folylpolyglutamate synthase/dihydrofolate synthase family protein [Candidatus Thioglobus sp. NP1]|uniref:bifunctional folylpolyglutamate synthase/dihydrofolate synthase n=1 Tax=Candidatus Thioglobus sp. NP1 TaxID=2508687 RepID=UPI000DED6DF3|nr:folylpolyglutamate synthase/dihydrofolate synthase family protein [Candidatus Thioglobus sp. NP1]AXE61536.1 bifunctional folylpolyglutamate synthase/dihydrofolate synthase [Candidatus Thioglobus sp. NP1]
MQTKRTLDEWLTWQETLMEETIVLGLDRVKIVYDELFPNGVPFKVITIGGTNGKGSSIAFIDSIYEQSKYKIGRSTSPHLLKYNERFAIDGKEVSDASIISAFELIEQKRDNITLTYFEFSTLATLIIFADARVDLALLEVGLGGRLDSVNVVDCNVSIITNIAIDHIEYLGDTREAIGYEKAGIMRNSIHCICGDQDPPLSLLNYAKEINAPLTLIKEGYQGEIGLEGAHQRINAAVAIKAIEKLNYLFPVTNNMIVEGIKKAQIAARFQKIIIGDKTVILDVAHNPAAVETLVNTLLESPIETVAIFSALADKNIDDMIKLSSNSIKQWFLVPLSSERSIQLDALNDKFADSQTTTVCANMDSAINETLGLKNIKRIVIFGSFYTIADASEILNLM